MCQEPAVGPGKGHAASTACGDSKKIIIGGGEIDWTVINKVFRKNTFEWGNLHKERAKKKNLIRGKEHQTHAKPAGLVKKTLKQKIASISTRESPGGTSK